MSFPPRHPVAARLALAAVVLLGPLSALAALVFGFDPVAHEAAQPLIHRDDGFIGSNACRACHEAHYESWARTFHRTMTQRADAHSVVGAFDGRVVSYAGKSARPLLRDGRFFMELSSADGGTREAEVALAVGSRRYQQYFEREGSGDAFAYRRLPILWHIGARRWLHLNAVFLNPDSPDWDEHRATWNENCVFCHNTGPEPRQKRDRADSRPEPATFDSKVAELGIACEACHGPGEQHAEYNRDPLHRYGSHLAGAPDPFIVDPKRLDQERAVSICGQCHGQRLPEPISRGEAWLTTGPTFRSGDRLLDHARPLSIDTPAPAGVDPDLFRLRFWSDGTPRLTAYEHQGVTASPCYRRGSMTCGSCHTMHGGDVHGQIEPAMRGDQACLQCHGEIGRDVAAHTRHAPSSSGSRCLECHMPRIVYGIAEIHRSHRIESPDPGRDAEGGRPDACTLCHLDKSPLWSAAAMARWWGPKYETPRSRADGASLELADSVASLLAGDAVQRAVYARAMSRTDSPIAPRDKAFLRLHLAVAMGDGYPSIRWLAQRSLASLEEELPIGLEGGLEPALGSVDPMAGPDERRKQVFGLIRLVEERSRASLRPAGAGLLVRPDFTLDLDTVVRLADLQGEHTISIGE